MVGVAYYSLNCQLSVTVTPFFLSDSKTLQIYFQGNIYHPALKLVSVPLNTLKQLFVSNSFGSAFA